ncbi:unnamed protein product [Vitrella brassicaformis CCMP3155]|uniref:Rubisco LSMT substrate-binding domain-containing protein n=2 Tax=Vitrella brassicaformis TaxID=1169539 RepID=A0A0G4FPP8_VITBC|nr:unnamed protein product [Vitrella brassicaformis CCMP3155]|eukprot:CEM15809.1 unnamed protein product [Vitrella brassicaformis CCMP3155]
MTTTAAPRNVKAKKRRKERETPWYKVLAGAVILVALAVGVYFMPSDKHLAVRELIRTYGGYMYTTDTTLDGKPSVAASRFVPANTAIAFVPVELALNYNHTDAAALRLELHQAVQFKQIDLWNAAVLSLIAERRNTSSFYKAWLNSLPKEFPFSYLFTKEQKKVLKGTPAEPFFSMHDRYIDQITTAGRTLDFFVNYPDPEYDSGISLDEAAWAVGAGIHMMWGDSFVPGPLDQMRFHWDPDKCVEPMMKPQAFGGTLGYVLVSPRDINKGEHLFQFKGRLSSGESLALLGYVLRDNPLVMTSRLDLPQDTVTDKKTWAQILTQVSECKPDDLLKIPFHDAEQLVPEKNLKCITLLMLNHTQLSADHQARDAITFFDVWPRVADLAHPDWLTTERELYESMQEKCRYGLAAVLDVNPDVVQTLEKQTDSISQDAVFVRRQLLSVLERCQGFFQTRIDMLPKPRAVPPSPSPVAEAPSVVEESREGPAAVS